MKAQRTADCASGSEHDRSGHERSIQDLVLAARSGDAFAFTTLVQRFQDSCVAYAAALVQDYDVAQDAAQDAFIDAHRLLPTLRDAAAFPAWFRTIVFKHCDRYRRRQRRLVELGAADDSTAEAAVLPQDSVESAEEREIVHAAVAKLPAAEREVVLLFYMAGESQASISAFLGINENTVKTRLYSARRKLRRLLDEMLGRLLGEDRPSNDPRFIRRVIASALPLQVWSIDRFGARASVGATISARTAEIPETPQWSIGPSIPLDKLEWSRVLRLMRSMKIPGLVAGPTIDDEVLEEVSKLEDLSYLDLSGASQATDRGIQSLGRCARLEYLDVSGTRVTDAALSVVGRLHRLRAFECRHNEQVSDAGLVQLQGLMALERVNLMGSGAGDGSLDALRGKSELREVFLGNAVTDAGLGALADIPSFAAWRDRPGEMSLLSPQVQGTFLWLNRASAITDRGLERLQPLVGLAGISIFGGGSGPFDDRASRITAAGLQSLASLEQLVWLGCASGLCDDQAMRYIATFPRLRFLMCQDAVAGDAGFGALAEAPRLEFIWGRRCYNLGSAGFAKLATMPMLRGLAVSCRNVGLEALKLLPAFPRLAELMPIDVSDDGFRCVGECERLEALHCMYCTTITDRAAAQIVDLPRLRTYQAWSTQATDQTPASLSAISTLEHVRFSGCKGITDRGVLSLRRLPNLKVVDLERLPRVTIEGASLLPKQIRVNFNG